MGVAIDSNGRIVIAGTGAGGYVTMRLLDDGSFDPSFDSDGSTKDRG